MTKFLTGITAVLMLMFSFQAFAQGTQAPGIDRRIEDARARVSQGFRNGSLTRGEHDRLSRDIDRVSTMRRGSKRDGVVTDNERRNMRDELNRIEADIDRLTLNYNKRR